MCILYQKKPRPFCRTGSESHGALKRDKGSIKISSLYFLGGGEVGNTKLGQLCLNEGYRSGRQIISGKWIAESTQVQSVWKARHLKYGYLWWVIDETEHSFAALGDGGNALYVNPKDRIVVAVSSLFVPRVKDRVDFMKKEIEPLFK